jgi:hypothetical protein
MAPLRSIARHSSCTVASWSGSVVRMKSSFEISSAFQVAR